MGAINLQKVTGDRAQGRSYKCIPFLWPESRTGCKALLSSTTKR